MTRTEELLALAAEAKEIASGGMEKPWQVREVKLAVACEQLVELAVLQNEALKWVEEIYAAFDGVASSEITDAIASFERFEQGGESIGITLPPAS